MLKRVALKTVRLCVEIALGFFLLYGAGLLLVLLNVLGLKVLSDLVVKCILFINTPWLYIMEMFFGKVANDSDVLSFTLAIIIMHLYNIAIFVALCELILYFWLKHSVSLPGRPSGDQRPENGGGDAETGEKIGDEPDKITTEKGESEDIEQK